MRIKLENIAGINSGHTFREKVISVDGGDLAVFQMQNLDMENLQLKDPALKIKIRHIPESQLLKRGDILFLTKGPKNFAFTFQKEYPAVASSVFFVLRPDKEKIYSEYLCWYLNQESTQLELRKAKEGTTILNINKKTFEELSIKVPSLFTQQKLVNLYMLWQVEKEKTAELINMKDKYYNNLALHEIDPEHEVEPYTDRYEDWFGYYILSTYYFAAIEFYESIILKGNSLPVKKALGLITGLNAIQRTVNNSDGSSTTYTAAMEWKFVEKSNSSAYNDGEVLMSKRKDDFENTVPHSLIKHIEMFDRFDNKQ
ncbi:hypothetical protein BH11BAC7_BH11BAC7_22230 [soil metagenome]